MNILYEYFMNYLLYCKYSSTIVFIYLFRFAKFMIENTRKSSSDVPRVAILFRAKSGA